MQKDERTPLHRWVGNQSTRPYYRGGAEEQVEELRLLSEYSKGRELWFLDATGNTPLHTLIDQKTHPDLIRAVLEANSQLLCRENAVGRTPAERANDVFVETCMQEPREPRFHRRWRDITIADTLILGMTMPDQREACGLQRAEQIYDVVKEFSAKSPGKRRLVSLHGANDVAKRIGDTYSGDRYGWRAGAPRGRRGGGLGSTLGKPGLKFDGLQDEEGVVEDQLEQEQGDFVLSELCLMGGESWR